MYIDKVIVKNLRGFRHLEFSFDRGGQSYAGWTVITGDNGSGKSTLLKAIAVALTGKEVARTLEPSFSGWIRAGEKEASIDLSIVPVDFDDSPVQTGRRPASPFPARIVLKNGGRETGLDDPIPPAQQKTYKTPSRSIWAAESSGWFACGYGPFRRVFGASSEATRHMVAPTTERFVTMFYEAASLAEVDQWLRNLSHKHLERKSEGEQLTLLLDVLRDDLLPNEITVDRVDSDGLWLKDRNGVRLAWREMSDGYRSAVALLADIIRHLFNTYGSENLFRRNDEGRLVVGRSGVVLIDEIDAHLHPEWQRTIGFWLKYHFPNLQFLVTTHSPIILQAADPNGIFRLPEPGSESEPRALTHDEYTQVIASRPDTILLSPAFGLENTRSPRAVEARARRARLAAKKRAGAELTAGEQSEWEQLNLFVNPEEER